MFVSILNIKNAVISGDLEKFKTLIKVDRRAGLSETFIHENKTMRIVHLAAMYGRVEMLDFLKSRYQLSDSYADNDAKALHFAKDAKTAAFFLESGSRINSYDRRGQSPSYRALVEGRTETALYLIDFSYHAALRDFPRSSMLAVTVKLAETAEPHLFTHYINVINHLLTKNPKQERTLDHANYDTPLHGLAKLPHLSDFHKQLIRLLVEKAPDLLVVDKAKKSVLTYLKNNHIAFYTELAKDYPEKFLEAAVRDCDVEEIKRLLKQGSSVGKQSILTQRILHLAAKHSTVEIVDLLLKAGAIINERDQEGKTPLFYVSSLEMSEYLCEHGADVNVVDGELNTPLIFLVTQTEMDEHLKMLNYLIDNQANVLQKNKESNTALSLLVNYYASQVTEELLTLIDRMLLNDVNINERMGAQNETLLGFAVNSWCCLYRSYKPSKEQSALITHLIAKGADPTIKMNAGRELLSLAADEQKSELEVLLRPSPSLSR